jgi:antitoxin VapB
MTLHIRDPETDELARTLASRQNISITDAVRRALANELRRLDEAVPLPERIAALRARVLAHPPTGLEADKVFYDQLSGDNAP